MSEILNTWRQLIEIKKQQSGQWGSELYPVKLYEIDRVLQHFAALRKERDETVSLLLFLWGLFPG